MSVHLQKLVRPSQFSLDMEEYRLYQCRVRSKVAKAQAQAAEHSRSLYTSPLVPQQAISWCMFSNFGLIMQSYVGAGFLQNSSSARSFSNGGDGGQYGGFGGGGAVGVYGGGGGGGYSGGGGGRGGGGGGSYVRDDGIDVKKKIGNEGHGSVTTQKVSPPYPIDERDNGVAVGVGGGGTRDIPSTRAFSTASPPNTSIAPVDSSSTLAQFSHPTQITSQSSRSSQSSQLSENGSSSRLWSLSSTTAQHTASTVFCDLGPVTEAHIEDGDGLTMQPVYVTTTISEPGFHANTVQAVASTAQDIIQHPAMVAPPVTSNQSMVTPLVTSQSDSPYSQVSQQGSTTNASTNAQSQSET